jgi:hypothetical protein
MFRPSSPFSFPGGTRSATRVNCLLYRRVNKNCLRAYLFEAKIYGPTDRSGAVERLGRNSHTLPRLKSQLSPILEVNHKASFHDNEELVRCRMIVPAILPFENRQPKAASIDSVDHLVPIRLDDACAFFFQVRDMKRGVFYRLVFVSFCSYFHTLPPYSANDSAHRGSIT